MKRLTTQLKNSGIIMVEMTTQEEADFTKNLMTALKKFSSSRKTRATHRLVQSGNIQSAIFSGDGSDILVGPMLRNSELRYLLMNLEMYDDSLAGHGSVKLASQILDLDKQIKKEETFISEKRLLNIEKLQENRDEVGQKFLKSLDYIKMVDGIYFGWLLVLAINALNTESKTKSKIVTVASEILASILKKIYKQTGHQKIESDVHQLIEAISILFIKTYFYGESTQYALNDLKKAFSEDIIDTIKRTKITKIDKFSDISKFLKETELMAITENTFDSLMTRMFGRYAYETYIQSSLADFLAFMANLTYNTQLFKDSYPVDDDSHKRLEELLLNEQKNIKIRKEK